MRLWRIFVFACACIAISAAPASSALITAEATETAKAVAPAPPPKNAEAEEETLPPDTAETAAARARRLFEQPAWEQAYDAYTAALRDFPLTLQAREAAFRRGECLYRLKLYEKAARVLADFGRMYPQAPERAFAEWRRGDSLLRLKREREAAVAFGIILDRFPTDPLAPVARYWRGESLWRAGDEAEGALILQQAAAEGDAEAAPLAHASLGYIHFNRGECEQALEHFNVIIEKYPLAEVRGEAMLRQAECLARLDRGDEALETYAALEKADGDKYRRQIVQGKARIAFDRRQYDEAATFYETAAREVGEDYSDAGVRARNEALFNAALARYHLGEYQAAADSFGRIAVENPTLARECHYWHGLCLAAQDKHSEAIVYFRSAIEEDDGPPLSPEDLARCLIAIARSQEAQGDNASAAVSYQQAHEAAPGGPQSLEALYAAARVLAEGGMLDEAAEQYRRLLLLAPETAGELRGRVEWALAEILYRGQSYSDAAKAYAELLAKKPEGLDAPLALRRLGWCLMNLGKADDAAPVFARLVKEHPQSPWAAEAGYMRGKALVAVGDAQGALAVFTSCQNDYAGTEFGDKAAIEIGRCLQRLGREGEARQYFEAILEKQPDAEIAMRARLALGDTEIEANRPAIASEHFNAALQTNPSPTIAAAAKKGIAFALRAQNDFAAAAAQFDAWLADYPGAADSDEALFWAARSYDDAGDFAAAAERYQRLLREYPKTRQSDIAVYLYSRALARQASDQAGAVAEMRRFIQQYPESAYAPQALNDIAGAFIEAGQTAEAAAVFTEILDKFPKSAVATDAALYLGDARFVAKDYAGAIPYYQRALDASSPPQGDLILYRLGFCGETLERIGEARDALTALLERYPKSEYFADAAFRLGRVCRKLNDLDAAALYYDKVRGELGEHAAIELGYIELDRRRPDAAVERFARALAMYPRGQFTPQLRLGLALAYIGKQAYNDAEREITEVLAMTHDITAARAREALGRIKLAEQDYFGAAREFLFVARIYDYVELKPGALLQAAQAYETGRERDRALNLYNELVANYPDSAEARQAAEAVVRLGGNPR